MALSKETLVAKIEILEDGQVKLTERTTIYEGGVQNGTVVAARQDERIIDVGDPVAAESPLIRDIVSGNLHNAARLAARNLVR